MAIAKVILNDASQIDLTSDTVTAESLLSGYTAHDASGTQITGTASGGGSSADVEIIVLSENLHDSSEDVVNTYINGSTETSYNGWTSTGYIAVKPDTYYKVANTPGNNYNALYKSDKTVAKGGIVVPQSTTTDPVVLIKTTSNTSYIRMSGASSGVTNYEIYEVNVVEVGSSSSGGGNISGNVADFLALVPAFDDTWSTTEFSILSYPSSQYIEVPHTLGRVPDYAVVLKTDITLNDIEGIIGGYNFIGGAKTDSALNRNIKFANNSGAGSNYDQLPTTYKMGIGQIINNNWNFVGAVCPDWTAEKISFRIGNSKNTSTGFCLGQYILGVKKVQ